jgi:hypothetical protein
MSWDKTKIYTSDEGAARRDEVLKTRRETYDHVKLDAVNPGDPASRVRVLARRHDDHSSGTKSEEADAMSAIDKEAQRVTTELGRARAARVLSRSSRATSGSWCPRRPAPSVPDPAGPRAPHVG